MIRNHSKNNQQTSLRQVARDLGVSASYLSQVRNGKKKPSNDLLSKIGIKVLTKLVNTTSFTKVDFGVRKFYNSTSDAEVAQVVEQRTENPRVPSSILGLGTTASDSPLVESASRFSGAL